MYTAGFASKLIMLLGSGSVPTVRDAEAANVNSTSQTVQLVKHVACQMDLPARVTVGTQLSLKTLQLHVKSTGTQTTTVSTVHFGVGMSTVPFFTEPLFKVHYPKSKKGECTAKPAKTDASFNYIDKLIDLIFDQILQDPATFVKAVLEIPVPADLCAEFDRPAKEDIIASYVSQFSREAV